MWPRSQSFFEVRIRIEGSAWPTLTDARLLAGWLTYPALLLECSSMPYRIAVAHRKRESARSPQNREQPRLQYRREALRKTSGEVIVVKIRDHALLDSPAHFPLAELVS